MAGNHVKVGASIPSGIAAVKAFKKMNLGNFILTAIPLDFQEAMEVASFCKKNSIFFVFSEYVFRGQKKIFRYARKEIPEEEFHSLKELEAIYKAGGEFYMGRYLLGEAGGLLYWPREYVTSKKFGLYNNLPKAKNVEEAKELFIAYLKDAMKYEERFGKEKYAVVDSSILFKYFLEAGIQDIYIEVLPGNCDLILSAARGACAAYGKKGFGAHIAMACYGGSRIDTIWLKRWKNTLFYSFLSGAESIFPESGHITYNRNNEGYTFSSPQTKETRQILRDLAFFTAIHDRPAGFPSTKIGIVHGNFDGYPGLWNEFVWGQFHDSQWVFQDAEKGWKHLSSLFHKTDWFYPHLEGEKDSSGTVPNGLYDIVPAEADPKVFERYSCLIFLGWNTMTEKLYKSLQNFVKKGGHLLMAVPHLNCSLQRNDKYKLFRNGDFSDLFGLKIMGQEKKDMHGIKFIQPSSIPTFRFPVRHVSDPHFIGEKRPAKTVLCGAKTLAGFSTTHREEYKKIEKRPFLTEYSLGKGKAFLLTTWDWPGADGMAPAVKEILRVFMEGEQEEIRILAGEKIRYSSYTTKEAKIFYILNTDFDHDIAVSFYSAKNQITFTTIIPACSLRIFYFDGKILYGATDHLINLASLSSKEALSTITFYSYKKQSIELCNLTKKEHTVLLNKKIILCEPGKKVSCILPRTIEEKKAQLYKGELLKEPKIDWPGGHLPY
ncbi:MAG: hypothetical protein WDA18_03500 [Candidatus Ratteibacteria bacterium]|jgi:hypothetical protein